VSFCKREQGIRKERLCWVIFLSFRECSNGRRDLYRISFHTRWTLCISFLCCFLFHHLYYGTTLISLVSSSRLVQKECVSLLCLCLSTRVALELKRLSVVGRRTEDTSFVHWDSSWDVFESFNGFQCLVVVLKTMVLFFGAPSRNLSPVADVPV